MCLLVLLVSCVPPSPPGDTPLDKQDQPEKIDIETLEQSTDAIKKFSSIDELRTFLQESDSQQQPFYSGTFARGGMMLEKTMVADAGAPAPMMEMEESATDYSQTIFK